MAIVPRNLRVLIFLPALTRGGAEKQGLCLARYLKKAGCQVEVWGFPSPSAHSATVTQPLQAAEIPHRELPRWPPFRWDFSQDPLQVRRWFRQHVEWPRQVARYAADLPPAQFDVVVPFTFWPSLVAALVGRRWGPKQIIWNHRGGFDNAGIDYSRFLVERVLDQRPTFVANSTAGGVFLQHTFALDPHRVHVIPNAYVSEREENETWVPVDTSATDPINLLHLANFFPEKDADTLLDAVRLLKASNIRHRLHLAGSFPDAGYMRQLEQRIAALEVDDCVTVHGGVDDAQVRRLLGEADIGLLSSKSEGMPNSVMEYMYHRLPVIGTDIPGIREVVGSENAAWLFPIGDAARLKRLIESLTRDSALRKQLGAANRERIVKEFSAESILPKWLRLLELS